MASLHALVACGPSSHTDDAGASPDAFAQSDAFSAPDGFVAPDATAPADAPVAADAALEPCTTVGATEDVACGRCGTATRFCTSSLRWELGACADETGVCEPDATGSMACGADGTVMARCTSMCAWDPVGDCSTPPPTCDAPLVAPAGTSVSVTGSTFGIGPGALELGAGCNLGAMPDERAGQVVVRYVVPGTGPREVRFSTANDGTAIEFDTKIQVRRGDCTATPSTATGTCFDRGMEVPTPPPPVIDDRALGVVVATGGETLYFVVTGFGLRGTSFGGHVYEGPFQLDISVADPTLPTLSTVSVAHVVRDGSDYAMLALTGDDAGGDVEGAYVTLLDGTGTAIDVDGSGTVDAADDVDVSFFGDARSMSPIALNEDSALLGGELVSTHAARARVRLYDSVGNVSAPLTVDVAEATEVHFGDVCDATHVCVPTLLCTAGHCAADPEIARLCGLSSALSLAGTPPHGSASSEIPIGPALLPRPFGCGGLGAESLHDITVPTGAWDLIASTANAGTATDLDTVVYALATCEDVSSGPPTPDSIAHACADDQGDERRAVLEVRDIAPGPYTIAVVGFLTSTMTRPYQLDVSLRPVLATGASCDPMGVENRCAAGDCSALGVCP
ncbi:MAG: hypothetical protein U0353_17015 [Sandaracinus sp.]